MLVSSTERKSKIVMHFKIHIYANEPAVIAADGNVDVEVLFADGTRYAATFFALANIRYLMTRYKETGECGHGLYFFASNMIIVDVLSKDVIEKTITDLIEEGDFLSSPFLKLSND